MKPSVFLSHSSIDEKPLRALKELLVKKTGGAIALFLSSDGQSIPLGRNWVHEVQQALDESQLMFVFISPNSLRSSWLHFEAGYTYSKGIRVVPVGILGIDLGQVAPPISLLQGFNLTSGAGLNNLIAIMNQEFQHQHEESFTPHDFESIFTASNSVNELSLAPFLSGLISEVRTNLKVESKSALEVVTQCLERNAVSYVEQDNVITTYGMSIALYQHAANNINLNVTISSDLARVTLPIASEFITTILGDVNSLLSVKIEFAPAVSLCEGHENVTARLYGTEIKLDSNNAFQYRDIAFTIERSFWPTPSGMQDVTAYVNIECKAEQLGSLDVEGLLNILFDKKVLLIDDRANTFDLIPR